MSLPQYGKYKRSGVVWLGHVPKHWEIRRLGTCFCERREKGSDKEFPPLSVTMNGIVPQLGTAAKTDDGDNRKRVRAGDFVINSRSDRRGSSGISTLDGSVSLINTVLIPKSCLNHTFVHYLLRSEPFQKEFYRYGKGIVADLWSTNYSEMRNIMLALPSLTEQSSIAKFLSREVGKIDELIAAQLRLIDLLKEKQQALISRAVTKGLNPDAPVRGSGIEYLGKVPTHWVVAPLGYRYRVQLGKMLDSSRITGKHLRPYLRVFDVQWGSINIDDLPRMDFDKEDRTKFRLQEDDLLVNEGGSYPGRSAIWTAPIEECYYQKALHRMRPFRPAEDSTHFLFYLMFWAANRGVFIAGGNETTIEHLPAEKLRKYRFAFPPFSEQVSISSFLRAEVSKLDCLSAEAARAIGLLQERRVALISAAVTGKIDVRQMAEVQTA
jgi:type I restriction enzyme, S subunit